MVTICCIHNTFLVPFSLFTHCTNLRNYQIRAGVCRPCVETELTATKKSVPDAKSLISHNSMST